MKISNTMGLLVNYRSVERFGSPSATHIAAFPVLSNDQQLYVSTMTTEWVIITDVMYVGYSECKYRLRVSLAHPQDCNFAYVRWLPLSIEKPQTPFREIRAMFMFVPVR